MEDFLLLDLVNRMTFAEYIRYTFSGEQYHLAFLFRPLSHYAYWWLGQLLFDLNYQGFHAVNLLIHAGNSILVAFLGTQLTRRTSAGVIAGTIYAIGRVNFGALYHLPHVQDLLVTFLALVGLLSYTREAYRSGGKAGSGWLAPVSFALALGAKESAIMIPAVLLLYDLLFVLTDIQRWNDRVICLIRRLWPFAAISLIYLALRLPAMSYGLREDSSGYGLTFSLSALGRYGWGAFWSLEGLFEPLRIIKVMLLPEFHPLSNKPLVLVIGISAVLTAGSLIGLAIKNRKLTLEHTGKGKAFVFGLLWFLVIPLPIIFVPPFAADLFITASVGVAIAAACALGLVLETALRNNHEALLRSGVLAFAFALAVSGRLLIQRVESETSWLEYSYLASQAGLLIAQNRADLGPDSTVYLVGFPEQVFPWSTGEAL